MRLLFLFLFMFSTLTFAESQFKTGSAIPSKELVLEVENIYYTKIKDKKVSITVEGHTDLRGDKTKNLKLSQKRAEAITNKLISLGVNKDDITPIGLGSSKPISKDHDLNRRVVINIKDNKGLTDSIILSDKKPDNPPILVKEVEVIKTRYVIEKQESHKNILSIGGISSHNGLIKYGTSNNITVEEDRVIGASFSLMRRVNDNLYLGVGIDTNGGRGVSIGFGF